MTFPLVSHLTTLSYIEACLLDDESPSEPENTTASDALSPRFRRATTSICKGAHAGTLYVRPLGVSGETGCKQEGQL